MEYDNYRAAMEMITEIFDIETVKWERRKPFPLAFCIPILCCVCPAYAKDFGAKLIPSAASGGPKRFMLADEDAWKLFSKHLEEEA